MKRFNAFLSGIVAGALIAIGGLVFLALDNKVLGALFFCVGLFTICTFGFNLFTGKVCYLFDNDKRYAVNLLWIWLGNLVGTGIIALLARCTRLISLSEKAAQMCAVKMDDSLISLFILGILCDILIYIAVDGYKNNPHEIGKYLSLLFGVTVFILAGFEHSVADMFYFFMAGIVNGRMILCLVVISLGNAVGGVIIPLMRKIISK